ncbi:MAG: hypothetical protein KQI81_09070 [Deltaproteobacteria bacterium]|nr:hypothetical protein [Deltaproteobacteria bacterium]
MKIPITTLRDWMKENRPNYVHVNSAFAIITRFYCWRMTQQNLCPKLCSDCKVTILDLLDLRDAKKPEALLTYKAKAIVAELADQKQTERENAETAEVSDIGNPFLNLLEEINES